MGVGYINNTPGFSTSNSGYQLDPAFVPAYTASPAATAYRTAFSQPLPSLYTNASDGSQPLHYGQSSASAGNLPLTDVSITLRSPLPGFSPATPEAQIPLAPGTITTPGPVRKRRKRQPNKSQGSGSDKGLKPEQHTEGWTHDDWVQAGAIARPTGGVKEDGQKCLTCTWYSRACDANLLQDGKCRHCNGPPTSDRKRVCVWTVPSLGILCYPDYQKLREEVGLTRYRKAVEQAFLQSAAPVVAAAVNPSPMIQPSLPLVMAHSYSTGTILQPWNTVQSLSAPSTQYQAATVPAHQQSRGLNLYQGSATPNLAGIRVSQMVINAASYMMNHDIITENELSNSRNMYALLCESLLQNPGLETSQTNAMLSNLDDRHLRGVGLTAELMVRLARWRNAWLLRDGARAQNHAREGVT